MEGIEQVGFQIFPAVFAETEIESLLLKIPPDGNGRAGIRHALSNPDVSDFANDPRLLKIARTVLGPTAFPFRATFFSKTSKANWLVVWHQDTALPVRERRKVDGWGSWSVKAGVQYAHAPAKALEQVVALRVHLDDCIASNGPLRVLPGTHKIGVLTDDQVHSLSQQTQSVDCLAARGGVLAMRPLLIHSSSKAETQDPRRVLHIEYAASVSTGTGLELAIV